MDVAVLFIVMAVCLLIGVPIGVSLAISMFALLLVNPVTTTTFIAQSMYSGVASFTMLALPFFVLAGAIMDTGGISKRIVAVANSLVGNVVGGLGMVTIIACMFFGAISGSAPATVAAIGAIMIPQMILNGYDTAYATGLVAVAGSLGVVVPPSYPMVIYGVTNNVSIGALFMAGVGPALVVGGILMAFNYVYCKKRGYKGTGEKFSFKNMLIAIWRGKAALLMPVIILGGIYSGIFTPTEAAVVSVVYGIFIGVFVYRELSLQKVIGMFRDNVAFIGGMMFTFAPAASLGSIFSYLGIQKGISGFFLGISQNRYVILLLIFLILFIAGMFIQTTPCTVILSPILLSIAVAVGVDPIHFGVIMTLALCIAFVTPPVASNMFVAMTMTGLSMNKIVKVSIPFILALIVSLIICGFVPGISMWLVHATGLG